MNTLEVKDLTVSVGDKIILDNISFEIPQGEICAVMGPNGSGKSTLSNVIMGHPNYKVVSGQIFFNGVDMTEKKPEERAKAGMFMSFQHPREIAGVDFYSFLFDAYKSIMLSKRQKALDAFSFRAAIDRELKLLKAGGDWSERSLNQGFSGGEKKKAEMLQLAMLNPSFAIFDEIDSGLDVDALEVVGQALGRFKKLQSSALIITHYQRILKYIQPDKVLVMSKGRIIAEGDSDLAKRLEEEGFEKIINA